MALQMCSKCGRSFNFDSFTVHDRICRGQFQIKKQKHPVNGTSNYLNSEGEFSVTDDNVSEDLSHHHHQQQQQQTNRFKNPQESKFVNCNMCGKTFTIHSINQHKPACEKKHERERKEFEAQRKHDAGPSHVGRLPGVVCYICGRNFGTISIDIHEKQCLEKFRKQNNELPKKERRPEPIKPQTNKEMLEQLVKEQKIKGNGEYNMQAAMNDMNAAAYNQNLVACPNCSRTFNPDALKFHVKACTAKHPARKVGEVAVHH